MNRLKRYFPLIVVFGAFVWASVTIAMRRTAEAPPGAIVVRIGHWQLESGVRIAFEKMGRDFAHLPEIRKLGDVRIEQEAVPEGLYGQWLTSQMMAHNPPDLVEIGVLASPVLISYQNRYFVPLNDLAGRPNPFNAGTPLEGIPLKETFTDGMRAGYQEELQAYMRIPLARFSERLFYNRTLLRKLTGLEKPPQELHAFLALCDTIAKQPIPGRAGQHYTAIISSSSHTGPCLTNMADPLTFANLFAADFNRDGTVGTDETYAAFTTGRMSLADAPWRGRLDIVKDLTREFQAGFLGATRDEALFIFAQQRGVFICTGTWDVNSLIDLARGNFEVGIANFPFPSRDDPEYGKLVFGPVYDPAAVAFPFGLTRFSRHPDIAKAFLLYLASFRGNAELNRTIGWIPSVVGVPVPPALKDFTPIDRGMTACGNFELGGQTLTVWNQYYSLFESVGDYSEKQLTADFLPRYLQQGRDDWDEQQRDWRRAIILTDETLAALRGEALLAPAGNLDSSAWLRYRSALTTRQAFAEIDHRRMQRIVDSGPIRPVGPYAYLPEALDRARRTLAAGISPAPGPKEAFSTVADNASPRPPGAPGVRP